MSDEETKPNQAITEGSAPKDNAGILADSVSQFSCPSCGATLEVSGVPPFTEITCNACENDTTVPQKLGNFLLMRLIGTGGMGGVYFARDEQLGRNVAIKVMLQSLGDDPQFIETFRHEAQAVAKLNHANIAQIYSFGQEKGQPYIVMELVSGERVDELMEKPGGLSSYEAMRIALEIAQGLSAADEAGLVHGDIKPENILLDTKRNAKLVDFGLATVAHQSAGEGIWGTPYYICPEKIRRQKLDARSDIYCLGATLYHMLTRQPPFEGETPVEVVKARLEKPPPDPRDVNPDLPPIVSEIILRMLAVERTERYPNYRSLISDLRKAVELCGADAAKNPALPSGKNIRIRKKGSERKAEQPKPDTEEPEISRPRSKKLVIHKSGTGRLVSTGSFQVPHIETLRQELTDEERALRQEKQRRKRIRTVVTIFSILIIIGASAGGYAYWSHRQERIAAQRQRLEVRTLQQETESISSEITANRGRVERALSEIQPLIARATNSAERMNLPLPKPEEIKTEAAEAQNEEDGNADQAEVAEAEAAEPNDQRAGSTPLQAREREALNLIRESLGTEAKMQALLKNVQKTEEKAQASLSQFDRTTSVSQATSIRNAARTLLRNSASTVEEAQQLAQNLQRADRRITELRARHEADVRRRIEEEEERKRQEQLRAEQERARREHERLVRRELAQIPTFERELQGFLQVNDFAQAYNLMRDRANLFTTEEGRTAHGHSLERYRFLASMQENIIAGIQAEPYRWGYGSGRAARDIIGASQQNGLQVQGLPSPVAWEDVDPDLMVRLIDRYRESRDLNARQRTEITFGAAIYADLFGEEARDRARRYAQRAMALGLRRQTFENVLESRWRAEYQASPDEEDSE